MFKLRNKFSFYDRKKVSLGLFIKMARGGQGGKGGGKAQMAQVKTGVGNLSSKNRLRDWFPAQNLDRLLEKGFSEWNIRQESKTGS